MPSSDYCVFSLLCFIYLRTKILSQIYIKYSFCFNHKFSLSSFLSFSLSPAPQAVGLSSPPPTYSPHACEVGTAGATVPVEEEIHLPHLLLLFVVHFSSSSHSRFVEMLVNERLLKEDFQIQQMRCRHLQYLIIFLEGAGRHLQMSSGRWEGTTRERVDGVFEALSSLTGVRRQELGVRLPPRSLPLFPLFLMTSRDFLSSRNPLSTWNIISA